MYKGYNPHYAAIIKVLALLLAGSVAGLLQSCRRTAGEERAVLTVTIEPLRDVVASLAGDRFEVVTLMPRGASPETYEPTPRQMVQLGESQALFCVGTLGFECTAVPKMLEATPGVQRIDLSQGIEPLPHADGCHDAAHGSDPHMWMSAQNLSRMTANACEALCQIDAAHAAEYRERARARQAYYSQTDSLLKQEAARVRHRTFLIYHPALGYLAHQYGLVQLAVERDGKEPSVAYLQQLEQRCKADSVRVVFISDEHSGRAAQRLTESVGARVVRINPLQSQVDKQFFTILRALSDE